MLAEALDTRAVAVETQAGAPHAPIVDRPVARSGVEGQQRTIGADPGDVADAADVHHGERPRQLAREGCVIDRHQRRALPARLYVGDAQVAHYLDASGAPQRRTVADLPSEAPLGPMRDGLPMKAHDVERRELSAALARPALHGLDMGLGHCPLSGRCRIAGLLGAESRPYLASR